MKTVTTKNVYQALIRMRGYDPLTVTISAGELARIEELMNERLTYVYEYAMWPEILLVERRQYRATWDSTVNYSTGDEVYHVAADGSEKYYISLLDNNVNKDPDTQTTYWEEVGADFQRTIDFEQTGETEIGAVDLQDCVFEYDPRLYRGKGRILEVELYDDAIIVNADEAPTRPWIRFRPPAPVISLTAWAVGTSYAIGDVCYLASTGRSYKALAASTGKSPDSETAYWEPVDIPALFKRYIVHAVHADYLLDPVERGKEQNIADGELENLEDTQINQQGVERKVTFRR